ncbi:MAG: enoyl-CoA hydratase/isomerase family protein [Sporichthyaceae bacterium]
MDLVLVERAVGSPGVVTVTLNRPDRYNALIPELWLELRRIGRELRADDSVRVVVLTGAGTSFCSGIDRRALASGALSPFGLTGDEADRDRTEFRAGDVEASQSTFTWLTEAPFVTIAAVRGFALGAGAQLALACDLRVLGTDLELALLETEIGLLPDMTGTATLTRLVGYARSLELALTCRRIGAAEADRLGLATTVVEGEAVASAAAELASLIASRRPDSIRYTKAAIAAAATGDLARSNALAVEGGLKLLGGITTAWKT